MPSLLQSVGQRGRNDPFDVTVVQKLLTAAATALTRPAINPNRTDGRIDEPTIAAIRAFEREVMGLSTSDGRIRPNDRTWRRLLREAGEVDTNPDGWPERPDGVNHLGDAARDRSFTTFIITDEDDPNYPGYRDNPGPGSAADNIEILGTWVRDNIQRVTIPQLERIGTPRPTAVRFHRLAATQLLGLWQAWEDDGLLNRVLTFDGAYNARYKRNKPHITANLSNHCWGTAFDINYSANQLGKTPAIIWEPGCVFELVPLAIRWGFYWGGWFSGGRVDGMHFEVRTITSSPIEP
jgi:hypothetical protein